MRFLRYGAPGAERPAILTADGVLRDLSGRVDDLEGAALSRLDEIGRDAESLPVVGGSPRLGPPVAGVGKIICVGLNYIDHAKETNSPIPSEPILFLKATSSIVGPNDDVIMPRGSTKLDWEVELGVVIGRKASYVTKDDALAHVAGYLTVHDVSERAFQLERGGQWTKGKSCDTFAPLGPWLVTPEEVGDPQNLRLWATVDGTRRQNGTTATMIFGVAELVSYASQFFTLHPGDVISTGTPPGVGLGFKPPVFLSVGQEVEIGIEHLGVQKQRIVASL